MESDAYEALRRVGHIVGSPEHSVFNDLDQFVTAYGWLADRMATRIGPAPAHCNPRWPVFGWAEHNGQSALEYDRQRELPGHDDTTDAPFLVGFDVPDGSYLLSDFDDWHFVLNGWFLPSCGSDVEDDGGETDAFYALCERHGYDTTCAPGPAGPVDAVETMRRSNWGRIIECPNQYGSVQASMWELRWDWVFLVKARRDTAILKRNPVVKFSVATNTLAD
jgi:hypothetical protein